MGRNVPVSKPGRKKKLYQDLDNATNSLLDVQRQVTALQRQQSRLAIKVGAAAVTPCYSATSPVTARLQ